MAEDWEVPIDTGDVPISGSVFDVIILSSGTPRLKAYVFINVLEYVPGYTGKVHSDFE